MEYNEIQYNTDTRYAVHFGAGNIGRGFVGKLLSEAGYHVIFIDIMEKLIEDIRVNKSYVIETIYSLPSQAEKNSGMPVRTQIIKNVDAILSITEHEQQINNAIAHADLITTAIGANNLSNIAPIIAKGIRYRSTKNTNSLNVIACENMISGSEVLAHEIAPHLASPSLLQTIGFPCCSVDCVVVAPQSQKNEALKSTVQERPTVRAEEYCTWYIDKQKVKGTFLPIPSATLTNTLEAHVEKKLFILNTGHAIAAYLGHLARYTTIDEAIADKEILTTVRSAMQESAAMVTLRWNFKEPEIVEYQEIILNRFRNPLLQDSVLRVGRDPLRKLHKNDRLSAPVLHCLALRLPCTHLLKGIAAALLFSPEEDVSAMTLQRTITSLGLPHTIRKVTGIENDDLIRTIQYYYNILQNAQDRSHAVQ